MFTDIVGYTALAQRDEASALKLLDRHNRLLRPIFPRFHGKEVKAIGDSFLVEFKSALDATNCAIEIQRLLDEDGVSAPEESRVRVRIGIHLGDVVHKGGDVFGDSVNIASRMEPLAEPGGICISAQVFDQVRNKISNSLEKLEPKVLKNVQLPMEIYRVVLPRTVREPPSRDSGPTRLAVLPFANISPDPKDEYFADGLTEEMITVLSQLKELRVIARTSVVPYKSTSKGVAQIGTELGVDAVLEGSVRKAGDELRITVQLIDVGTQEHAWANTFDRKLEKVFAVQAEIARQVAESLKVKFRPAEEVRLASRPPVRPDSYLAYLKGRSLMNRGGKEPTQAAKVQFELAISLDPNNAAAYADLAAATHLRGNWSSDVPQTELDETGRGLVARALELDPNLAEAHVSLGLFLWDAFEWDAAEREFKLALSLNPSYSLAHRWYAGLLADEGRPDEALVELTLAEGTDPLSIGNLLFLARALRWLGRYDDALAKLQRIGELDSSGLDYHWSMAVYFGDRSDFDGCLRELNKFEESNRDPEKRLFLRAWYHAMAGEKDKARAYLGQLEALPRTVSNDHSLATIHALLGNLDECFRRLEKLIEDHLIEFQGWRLNPKLEHVRRDPRFQALLKKMNLA